MNDEENKIKQLTKILDETDNNIIFKAISNLSMFDIISIQAMTEVILGNATLEEEKNDNQKGNKNT